MFLVCSLQIVICSLRDLQSAGKHIGDQSAGKHIGDQYAGKHIADQSAG